MYFAEKLLEISRNFKKYLMESQVRCRKNPLGGVANKKCYAHISERRSYLKKNRPNYGDAQNKKEKSTKKQQQLPQKETAAKWTQPKRTTLFNEEITVVVG